MDPISILVLAFVGGGCGVLETRHLAGLGLGLTANMIVGALGALGAGLFFSIWGQLAPGILAPVASGTIGAAFVLPSVNWIVGRSKA